jgi:hypothetical protein
VDLLFDTRVANRLVLSFKLIETPLDIHPLFLCNADRYIYRPRLSPITEKGMSAPLSGARRLADFWRNSKKAAAAMDYCGSDMPSAHSAKGHDHDKHRPDLGRMHAIHLKPWFGFPYKTNRG